MSGLIEQQPTHLVILLQAQLKVSQLVNGIEYFVSATEVTLQNYQALQGMLFGIKKKWGGCCGELALPKMNWRHAHGDACLLSGPAGWHWGRGGVRSAVSCHVLVPLHRCLDGPVQDAYAENMVPASRS